MHQRCLVINVGCGDGQPDAGEQCDDGNAVSNDGCRGNCTLEVCGDGIVDLNEACDDGNTVSGDTCRGDCRAPACGDSIVDTGETCDDGNTTVGDGCDATCILEEDEHEHDDGGVPTPAPDSDGCASVTPDLYALLAGAVVAGLRNARRRKMGTLTI